MRPSWDSPLLQAPVLPADIRLGTSSWFFPGWRGLVYEGVHPQTALSKKGLAAYAQIPLLRTVSLDRTFYAPITTVEYARYAAQVPDHFSFVVKAPALVCDAVMRDEQGRGKVPNPHFLDPAIAAREFVVPCLEGLGAKAGPLVFQVSPLPRGLVEEAATVIERLAAFFAALPQELGRQRPIYALELRNAELLTPRLMRMLGEQGVRYCVGLHDRMPEVERQETALEALDGGTPGDLVVRWNLHRGFLYQAAKQRYEPFDRLVDEDPETRQILARMAARAFKAGRKVWITANNKAEGIGALCRCSKLAEEIAASSREALAALPVRLPLFGKRARPFLGVFAQVNGFEEVATGAKRGGPAHFGREIDQLAGGAHRERRIAGDGQRHLHGGRAQLVLRHHGIDVAELVRPARAQRHGREQQFHHDPLGQHVDQRRGPRNPAADLGLGDREGRVLARDAEVAHLRQQPATRIGDPVHGRDDRLGHMNVVAEDREEIPRRHADAGGGRLLEVHAGAKGLLAAARQDRDLQGFVLLEALPGFGQSVPDSRADGVEPGGAVQGDDGDRPLDLEQHIFGHDPGFLLQAG